MSIDIKIDKNSYNKIIDRLQDLAKNIEDMTPVWNRFEKYYLKKVKDSGFGGRGAFLGEKWPKYTKKYLKWKKKKYPGKGMLVLTGKLKNAATGGNDYESKKSKKQLTMKIHNIPYANKMHYQRPYWLQRNEQLPKRAILWLLAEIKKTIGINK